MIAVYSGDGNYEALLCEYAAGTLDEARGLIVSTHMTICDETCETVQAYQEVGGALLDECEIRDVSISCLEQTLARLDEPCDQETQAGSMQALMSHDLDFTLPKPLQNYVMGQKDMPAAWRRSLSVSGLMTYELPLSEPENKARLIKMPAGLSVPSHGHGGQEITLILEGAMSDEHGTYQVGDLIILDENTEHTPTADPEVGCICLAVTCAPIKLKGWASMFNPFLGK